MPASTVGCCDQGLHASVSAVWSARPHVCCWLGVITSGQHASVAVVWSARPQSRLLLAFLYNQVVPHAISTHPAGTICCWLCDQPGSGQLSVWRC
jgi:hypothetical protein